MHISCINCFRQKSKQNFARTYGLPCVMFNAGSDNVPAELLKYGADVMASVLCEMLQITRSNGKITGEWKEAVIITIPKNGDLSNCSNWRDKTLLNSIEKVLASIIVDCTSPTVNIILRDEQNGFTPQRSCVDYINTVRIILQKSVDWRSPPYLLFVDLCYLE